jgi:glucan phosphoethanolaminetransferase (alkaline phosphatase superfamily)
LDRAYSEKSFISIFESCGFTTYWFANQTPDYSYDRIAKSVDYYIPTSIRNDVYSDKRWTDKNILEQLYRAEDNNISQKLIVMHTIGSHWYYNYRYPIEFERFKPTVDSRSINSNSSEQIVNAYDNTVLFTDYFVSSVIETFRDDNTMVVFVSDHGELLGEDGKWLHASEHEVLYQSAFFIWLSDKYVSNYPEKAKTIRARAKEEIPTTTSSVFHTIIDGANIESSIIDSTLNLFDTLP